jgi:hypothetical protein
LIGWNAFDGRRIATEMTMDLICYPFRFRAGEVVMPATSGLVRGLHGQAPGVG